ncbi:MAG: pyrimidine/purine nucleoside phosphorylase [Gammaproteobacteria bacterium]|nr:pyrimidine/purine nucleoside phosphorylase [Gammaproteobacteria bacterium]
MFNVNEYFDGKVKSLAYSVNGKPATLGVMAKGDYEFGTSTVEHMTLISGKMSVKLPGDTDWHNVAINETFVVDANVKFQVKLAEDSGYLCLYE